MKLIIISTLLFITLPYSVFSVQSRNFPEEVALLDALAKSRTPNIGGSIVLIKNGFLGDGGIGFVYKGLNINNKCPVAVKFANEKNKEYIEKEFEVFICLNAYQNPSVETYGIPMVHHYGTWENFTFIAISKLDVNLNGILDEGGFNTPLNVLIIFRNFIVQSKYMHSLGIRHDDIKPGNIMVRGHRTFLIDFNMSAKMAEFTNFCTVLYASRRYHQRKLRHAIDDIESFLYSMLHMVGVPLPWFDVEYRKKSFEERDQLFGELKNQTQVVWNLINNYNYIKDDDLREIFNHFAIEVYDDSKSVPSYNNLERLITEKIMMYHNESSHFLPTFRWLSDDEKMMAMNDPLPDITDINDPLYIDYESFHYPEVPQLQSQPVAVTHDDEVDHHQMSSSSGSNAAGSSKKSGKKWGLFKRNKRQ